MTFPRALTRLVRGGNNAIALRFIGHGALADLEHVGRWSGTARHTPLRAFRSRDSVVIGLNFGRESDWLKNIQVAGGCRMRVGGQQLELGVPQIVPVKEGVHGMPWLFGVVLRYVVRTKECVELSIISSAPL